jgi:hypothetical protein
MDELSFAKENFYMDEMFSNVPLVYNHTGGFVLTNGFRYDCFGYRWKRKGEHPQALMEFIHDSVVPNTLVSDNAPEETP